MSTLHRFLRRHRGHGRSKAPDQHYDLRRECVREHGEQQRETGMNDMIVMGDIGDNRMYHRAREVDASTAVGAKKLATLHSLLDRAWFRDRHKVRFELQTMGNGPALLITRPEGQLLAQWTARGDTLVFTTASGTEVRAEILECAVSITCEFLDQARSRRH
jgi:hypothetical protein